jgi:nucleoside-diphosphate-sugar epimerase
MNTNSSLRILLIGGTGYIGSSVARALQAAGHTVVLLVRTAPDESGAESGDRGTVVGDLTDPATLRAAITPDIDAVVHAGAPLGDWAADANAVSALLDRVRPGGAFVYVSGIWVLGSSTGGQLLDEDSPAHPISIVAGREAVEHAVLTSSARGVVVRAGVVHGRGGGIPRLLVDWAREHGTGRFVAGATAPSWAVVHVEDLADLVVLALSQAAGGTILHAVAEASVPAAEAGRAADVAAGGAGQAVPWRVDEASTALGPAFAEALALNQHVSATRARSLGWRPTRPTLLDDLREGSYSARPSVTRSA